MEKEKKTNKAKEQQAVVPYFPSEIKLSMDWGGLVNEVRNLINEIKKEEEAPDPVVRFAPDDPDPFKDMSLDLLLNEVNKRLKNELSPEDSFFEEVVMGKEHNPFTAFKETFADYGFPNNIFVYDLSLCAGTIYVHIDGNLYSKRLDKEDLLRVYEEGESDGYPVIAYELFPKYFSEEVFRHSFRNYSQTQHDYSRYTVPEDIKIENPMLDLNRISAWIDGEFKTAVLLPADYIASLCFGEDGYRKPKATLEQLVAKYFLNEGGEEKCDIPLTAEIYADYLKETLDDMQKTAYNDTTSEWLAISDLGKSLSISDNKISGKVYSKDRLVVIEPILLAVKYMFCKEHKINLSDVPQVEVLIIGAESEERVVVEEVIEEQETVHRGGGRRGR